MAQLEQAFKKWYRAGFGSELLPIIPPDAEIKAGSNVRPEYRGKTPGVRTLAGTWSGLGGRWSEELQASQDDAKRWQQWGASVGLQSRLYPGLDIDVDDEALADEIEALAIDHLGLAPARSRPGSARRLLTYRAAEPLTKRRVSWGEKPNVQAVELLGKGQQYVVAGPHPKGGHYEWRRGESPCEIGADGISEITAEHLDGFFAALAAKLGPKATQSTAGAAGGRRSLDDTSLHASSPALVLEALKAWPDTEENVPGWEAFVAALAAIKAALGPDREDYYDHVEEWTDAYGGADPEITRKIWDSITDSAVGAEWLFARARTSGFTGDAQEDFDEDGDLAPDTALDRMVKRIVFVVPQGKYADLKGKSRELMLAKALNACFTDVAQFGLTGVKSAEAIFHNCTASQKAHEITYHPGNPTLFEDSGRTFYNTWRPSHLKPIDGMTDADVQPWLDLVAEIFGEPGAGPREHFLNYLAYALQHRAVKINHALVIHGNQGVGKDVVLAPFLEAIGLDNVHGNTTMEELQGGFTHYVENEVIRVPEMMARGRRDTYNRLKSLIAAPPYTVVVNRKNQQPYAIPNLQKWIMTTNHADAISMDDDDRRFWVHTCLLEDKMPGDYYAKLCAWYARHGTAKVAGWLLARDVTKFEPGSPPPMTDAKQKMIDGTAPKGTKWCVEALSPGGLFSKRTLVSAQELVGVGRGEFNAPQDIEERHALAALRRCGWQSLGVKLKLTNGQHVRPWTSSARPTVVAEYGHAKLVKMLEDEAKGKAA